jgi:hypothetical protein
MEDVTNEEDDGFKEWSTVHRGKIIGCRKPSWLGRSKFWADYEEQERMLHHRRQWRTSKQLQLQSMRLVIPLPFFMLAIALGLIPLERLV